MKKLYCANLVKGIENTKRNQHVIKAMSEHRSTAEAIKNKRGCSCNDSEENKSDNPVINAMTTPSTASVIKRKKERQP